METSYLYEYVSVADKGSFTAAARELHLTQSTLSKHVAALEREFGAELFVRDRSGVKLTEAGKVLYAQTVQIERMLKQTKVLVSAAQKRGSALNLADVGEVCDGDVVPREADMRGDTELRCKCHRAAARCGLEQREAGALVLYLEERSFDDIQHELGISRDELGAVLGNVYRKLGVNGKQEALDFIYSISE